MSKLSPDFARTESPEAASRKAGVFGALAFAAMLALGLIMLVATERTPTLDQEGGGLTIPALGIVLELVLVLVAAWRFRIGKGAYWGVAILLLFGAEVAAKIASGATNVWWLLAYASIFIALFNGVRGAWARRGGVDSEVFR